MRLGSTIGCVAFTTLLSGCLGPNPRLADCGERWSLEVKAQKNVPGSVGINGVCLEFNEEEGCIRPRGEMCLNRDQAENLVEEPDGPVRQALEAKAVAACMESAINDGATWHTCEEPEGIGDPMYEGRCMLSGELCYGSYGEETGAETSGGDTGGAMPDLDLDGVVWDGGQVIVPESVIESVLAADQATLWADGTTFAPHYTQGRQDGWEVEGVQLANLGGVLGFENGDVITMVGSFSVDTWDGVVSAANEALDADRIAITFERDGRDQTTTFVRSAP